jgi:hypothetical protein
LLVASTTCPLRDRRGRRAGFGGRGQHPQMYFHAALLRLCDCWLTSVTMDDNV